MTFKLDATDEDEQYDEDHSSARTHATFHFDYYDDDGRYEIDNSPLLSTSPTQDVVSVYSNTERASSRNAPNAGTQSSSMGAALGLRGGRHDLR